MAIVASGVSMVTDITMLTVGRLMLGMAGGLVSVAFGKMINETIPEHLVAKFSMVFAASVGIGYLAVFAPAELLPDQDDEQKQKEDEMWRVIWLTPAFIAIVVLLAIKFFFPYETVAFCLMKEKDEEGMLHLKKIYRKKN